MKPCKLLFLLTLLTAHLNTQSQVWNREIIDSISPNTGYYCDIAISTDDQPHISYMDFTLFDLKYAKKTNGKWEVTSVDTTGYTGGYSDISITQNNIPYISCLRAKTLGGALGHHYGLVGIFNYKGNWDREYLDTTRQIITNQYLPFYNQNSICTDINGNPIICYTLFANDTIFISYKLNNEWVEDFYYDGENHAGALMKLLNDDTPVILSVSNNRFKILKYHKNDKSWEKFTIQETSYYLPGVNQHPIDFEPDADNNLHIIHNSYELFFPLEYIFYDWHNFSKEKIGTGNSYSVHDLSIDKNGNPVIISYTDGLRLYKKIDNEWQDELIDEYIDSPFFISTQFDSENYPHIAVCAEPDEASRGIDCALIYYNFSPNAPDIELDNNTIDFGDVYYQSYAKFPVVISNTGEASMYIYNYVNQYRENLYINNFNIPTVLNPGESVEFEIQFDPSVVGTFIDTITLVTNVPYKNNVKIPVRGNAVATGEYAKLKIEVTDVFIDFLYNKLSLTTPVEDAEIFLRKNGTSYINGALTNSEGYYTVNNLSPGDYTLTVKKAYTLEDEPKFVSYSVDLYCGSGTNSVSCQLPVGLYSQKDSLMTLLNNIKESEFIFGPPLSYKKDEAKIIELAENWAVNINEARTNELARIVLTEKMVTDLFNNGYNVAGEMFSDLGDLIAFMFYSDNWGEQLVDILAGFIKTIFEGFPAMLNTLQKIGYLVAQEIIKSEIIQGIEFCLDLIGDEIGFPGDTIIDKGWEYIKAEYASKFGFSQVFGYYSPDLWDDIKNSIRKILEESFIQGIYIDQLTAPALSNAKDYAIKLNSNGEFNTVCTNTNEFIRNEQNFAESVCDFAGGLRNSAELLMITSAIMKWIYKIPGLGDYAALFGDLSFYMKITAYTEVSIAFGYSVYEFFDLPDNINDEVKDIFYPKGVPTNYAKTSVTVSNNARQNTVMLRLKSGMNTANDEFNNVLDSIANKLSQNKKAEAASYLENLNLSMESFRNTVKTTYSPVRALANQATTDSLENFKNLYENMIRMQGKITEEHIQTSLLIYGAVIDSTNAISDSAMTHINKIKETHQQYVNGINELLDIVSSNYDIPAIITVSELIQEKGALLKDESSYVKLKVMNTGSTTANNVYLKFEQDEQLQISGSDSIFIGDLNPGEESSEISIQYTLKDNNVLRVFWKAKTVATAGKTFQTKGNFVVKESSLTNNSPLLINKFNLNLFPNPVNDECRILVSLQYAEDLSIMIHDCNGKLIHKKNLYLMPGYAIVKMNTKTLSDGVYLVSVISKNNGTANAKMIVKH